MSTSLSAHHEAGSKIIPLLFFAIPLFPDHRSPWIKVLVGLCLDKVCLTFDFKFSIIADEKIF